MNRALSLALVAVASLSLAACTGIGQALAPDLPDFEVRAKTKISCSELVERADAADKRLDATQLKPLFKACEEMQEGVTLKPGAARQSLRSGALIPGVP